MCKTYITPRGFIPLETPQRTQAKNDLSEIIDLIDSSDYYYLNRDEMRDLIFNVRKDLQRLTKKL